MADRPILFSAPMVRALLAGTKTQTRRVLPVQPPAWVNFCEQPEMLNVLHQWVPSGLWRWAELDEAGTRALRQWPLDEDGQHYWIRPRFSVRDRLWVRESWAVGRIYDDKAPRDINPDKLPNWCGIAYPATKMPVDCRIRPSIHMPRWASRLTLTVTEGRVQRLQDISEEDALAEGIRRIGADYPELLSLQTGPNFFTVDDGDGSLNAPTAAGVYRMLWDMINGAGAWAANPWVSATTFTVQHQNIDAARGDAA